MSAEGLAAALDRARVRYVVIGVAGANYWARSGHTVSAAGREKDRLFLASHAEALRSLIDEEA